ncbi:regulatory protein RecX [Anaerostipes sp.]|uniref:regulatory protein RecX n=1 Tax=Anaerostipes sp. TaxID=1872530 RepID=UPI0025C44DFD|nr:regulatory protein RecX [Anaerostipes sp.]MBS7008482.1 regulatory protein RecX [Anaerostipes sp.]
MIVTMLEPVGKKQIRVYLDDERYCLLYSGDVRRLGLRQDTELSEVQKNELDSLLLRRAKLKAMNLLKVSDRTKEEIRMRLKRLELPERCIEGAVSYVEGYHYIDDEAYVRRYIEFKGASKSRLKIKQELSGKGISQELFERIWEEFGQPEEEVLREQIKKRIRQKGPVTEENFQKNLAFFARKGFSFHDILEKLKEFKE